MNGNLTCMPMESVDVVLITLNSDRKLQACLESIYQKVNVNKLIAVDGGSTDRTLQIFADFNAKYGNIQVDCICYLKKALSLLFPEQRCWQK